MIAFGPSAQWGVLAIVLLLGASTAPGSDGAALPSESISADFIRQVKAHDGRYSFSLEFQRVIPAEARSFQLGCWEKDGYWIAVGHSTQVAALGDAKGNRVGRNLAEEESRALILKNAAVEKRPNYDADSYDLEGEISGFQTAGTFKPDRSNDFYLIGVVKKSGVRVDVVFNPQKARASAIALFEAGKYAEAAKRLAALTQRGIQDPETMAFARAASWHVNLDAGVKGERRAEALNGLGQFYLEQRDYEASLRNSYDLYLETEAPSRELLTTLVTLCEKTRRADTAAKFQAEINKRWPLPPPPIKEATIEPAFEPLLMLQPVLLKNGGARLLAYEGKLYFVAVGTTDVRETSSAERIRRLRVGKAQAQRQAVSFLEQTKVAADEKLIERTTITTQEGKKTAQVFNSLDETTATKVQGALHSLVDVGTWSSPDGTLFFFAIGRKLD